MGTRSNIGIRNADNTITGIYCHWDGYPEWNGKILLEHYNDVDRVNALMELGDLSSLRIKLNPEPGKPHTFEFDEQQDDVCVAYGRDRGEKGTESKLFKTLSQFERYMNDSGAEYQYLFDNGKWLFRSYKTDWKDLTLADCK